MGLIDSPLCRFVWQRGKPQLTFCVSVKPGDTQTCLIRFLFFFDPESVRSLRLGTIWNCIKGTGTVWVGHQFKGHRGPVKRAYVRRDQKGSNPFGILFYYIILYYIILYYIILYYIILYYIILLFLFYSILFSPTLFYSNLSLLTTLPIDTSNNLSYMCKCRIKANSSPNTTLNVANNQLQISAVYCVDIIRLIKITVVR